MMTSSDDLPTRSILALYSGPGPVRVYLVRQVPRVLPGVLFHEQEGNKFHILKEVISPTNYHEPVANHLALNVLTVPPDKICCCSS